VAGVYCGDAIVDGDQHGDGEDDRHDPNSGCDRDEQAGPLGDGAMLVGCSEHQEEREGVPERHIFA
jgi:hypothetical protein